MDDEKRTQTSDEKKISDVSPDPERAGSIVPGEIMKHLHDEDEAMKALAEAEGVDLVIDEATNKRLLRKIDWALMPLMCLVYGLNYLDKTTLSYASVMGLRTDIHLVGDDYQWLGSLFYFGYLAWEFPTNRLLQRLPIGKYSAVNVFFWGLVLACFAGVKSFQGGVAVRFFLGLFEAAVTPGFALITSQWYRKEEQGLRTAFWFSFNGWAQIAGGLIAYGIADGIEKHGAAIAGWEIIYLVTGLLTAMCGIAFWFVVPDNQLNAWFLSKKDRILALERIRNNQQGVGNKHFKWYQFREALSSPLVWMMIAYSLVADIPNGGISNFFSQLIVSFGYTQKASLLYGTPGGAVEVVTIIAWGLVSRRWGNRLLFSSLSMLLAIMGICLIVGLPLSNSKGRLAGYYFTQASSTPFVALLSLVSSNIAGYTKKTTVAAMYLVAYCVGNIIGPQTFRPSDAPRYVPAEIVIIACYSFCFLDVVAIHFYCKWQNRKKRLVREQPGYTKLANQEFFDLTDAENPEFVYSL